jgi:hypothetical protein
LQLPVAKLAAGTYTIELEVAHRDGREAVVRRVDFEVK